MFFVVKFVEDMFGVNYLVVVLIEGCMYLDLLVNLMSKIVIKVESDLVLIVGVKEVIIVIIRGLLRLFLEMFLFLELNILYWKLDLRVEL